MCLKGIGQPTWTHGAPWGAADAAFPLVVFLCLKSCFLLQQEQGLAFPTTTPSSPAPWRSSLHPWRHVLLLLFYCKVTLAWLRIEWTGTLENNFALQDGTVISGNTLVRQCRGIIPKEFGLLCPQFVLACTLALHCGAIFIKISLQHYEASLPCTCAYLLDSCFFLDIYIFWLSYILHTLLLLLRKNNRKKVTSRNSNSCHPEQVLLLL